MKFKLFKSAVVTGKDITGSPVVIGGSDNLESQVNAWLDKLSDIEVVLSKIDTHVVTGQDGSIAQVSSLQVWYDMKAVKTDRQQTVSNQEVKPLRLVQADPAKE